MSERTVTPDRRKAIDDLYAVFAPDVVLEAEVEAILARIVAIDCSAPSADAGGEPVDVSRTALDEWQGIATDLSNALLAAGGHPVGRHELPDQYDSMSSLACTLDACIEAMRSAPSDPPTDPDLRDKDARYEAWVERIAAAEHEDCILEWKAVAVADPGRMVTQHMADAHWGHAHDLVRRLGLAALRAGSSDGPDPRSETGLDAAWAAAEAALTATYPHGFHGPSLWHEDKGWCAAGVEHSLLRPMPVTVKGEPTPAAALLALAARLGGSPNADCPHRFQNGPGDPWQPCTLPAGHTEPHLWAARLGGSPNAD
jgi:hypothetical protein